MLVFQRIGADEASFFVGNAFGHVQDKVAFVIYCDHALIAQADGSVFPGIGVRTHIDEYGVVLLKTDPDGFRILAADYGIAAIDAGKGFSRANEFAGVAFAEIGCGIIVVCVIKREKRIAGAKEGDYKN
jgi:hypothetical protein